MKELINKLAFPLDNDLRFLITLLVAFSAFFLTSYVLELRVERGDTSVPTEAVKVFPLPTLSAKAVYVYDARTKEVLYANNEHQRLPLASLTKLMSALVAQEISPQYGTVTISREALDTEGDSGLLRGEKWSLKDLLDFSLVSSSNDGINAVAMALGALNKSDPKADETINDFVHKMNLKAGELNLKNTYFWNATGLDETEYKGGAYGTARDITALMEYILANHPELLEATKETQISFSSLDNFEHTARNTNDIAGLIPGFLGSKTGYTNTAGGNLTFAFDPELGRPIIVTILGSTERGRFDDARKLIGATLKYINQ